MKKYLKGLLGKRGRKAYMGFPAYSLIHLYINTFDSANKKNKCDSFNLILFQSKGWETLGGILLYLN